MRSACGDPSANPILAAPPQPTYFRFRQNFPYPCPILPESTRTSRPRGQKDEERERPTFVETGKKKPTNSTRTKLFVAMGEQRPLYLAVKPSLTPPPASHSLCPSSFLGAQISLLRQGVKLSEPARLAPRYVQAFSCKAQQCELRTR